MKHPGFLHAMFFSGSSSRLPSASRATWAGFCLPPALIVIAGCNPAEPPPPDATVYYPATTAGANTAADIASDTAGVPYPIVAGRSGINLAAVVALAPGPALTAYNNVGAAS